MCDVGPPAAEQAEHLRACCSQRHKPTLPLSLSHLQQGAGLHLVQLWQQGRRCFCCLCQCLLQCGSRGLAPWAQAHHLCAADAGLQLWRQS